MAPVELDPTAQTSGLLSLMSLIMITSLVIFLVNKAIKQKDKIYYIFILFVISMASPWFPSGFGYVFWLITKNELNYLIYILLGTIGIPVIMLSWFLFYTTLIKPDLKTKLMGVGIIFSVVYYIYIFYFLLFAPGAPLEEFIGIQENAVDITYTAYMLVFIGSALGATVPFFFHFTVISIRDKDDPATRWRGIFMLLAMIFFSIGAFIDALVDLDIVLLIIIRSILLTTHFFFYLGVIMPKWLKKVLKIEANN